MHNIKRFTTFAEGAQEIVQLVHELESIFVRKDKDGNTVLPHEPDQVIQNIFKLIMENLPSVQDLDYPRTIAFSISADEVGFKTKGPVAFGWRNIITDHNTLEYSFRVSIFSNSLGARQLEQELSKHGWQQKSYTHLVHMSSSRTNRPGKSQNLAESASE
jgi:hypothetical protein